MKIQTVPGIFLSIGLPLLRDRGQGGVAPIDGHPGEAAAEFQGKGPVAGVLARSGKGRAVMNQGGNLFWTEK